MSDAFMSAEPATSPPATCIISYLFNNDSFVFRPGTAHGTVDNATCLAIFCSPYGKLEWYCYVLITVCILALAMGFVGNTAALLNYACRQKSWTSSTVFLFNLALCDFTWIIIVPVSVFFNHRKNSVFSAQTFCNFKKIFFNINIYGSIFFLTMISFDRYVGSAHPISSLKWWNKRKATYCTITIWAFIVIEAIPDFYYTLAVQRPDHTVACLDNIEGPLRYVVPITVSRIVFGFLIPCVVLLTCYLMTFKVLRQLKKRHQTRKRMMKPLMLVSAAMIVFAVSFGPYHVMMTVFLFYRMNYLRHSENIELIFALYELTEVICSISSCLDPILFILASNGFKNRLKAFKCSGNRRCCCCRSRRVGDVNLVQDAGLG